MVLRVLVCYMEFLSCYFNLPIKNYLNPYLYTSLNCRYAWL